ncbi:MAG TPA: cation transporter, partial [Actinokineospora sp.]|nr:cation transporter [Actinokineospora sp.]
HQATRLIGISFFILAAVVGFEAVRSLLSSEPPDASTVGIALTTASLIVMPILAWKKRQVATGLNSRAGIADSAQTFACVYLSAVVLIGLLLNSLFGWWWADPVAALGIVVLLLNEGREALFDDDDDDRDDD